MPIEIAKKLHHAFASCGKIDTALLNFRNAKKLCLFCLMRQKHAGTILPLTNPVWLKAK